MLVHSSAASLGGVVRQTVVPAGLLLALLGQHALAQSSPTAPGATPETLLRAVRAYASEMRRKGKERTEYVKQAQFWLSPRDRLWEHYARQAEPQKAREPASEDYLATLSDDRWREEVKLWKGRGGYWPLARMTPPPDVPRTAVPRHILADLNIHPARARAA